MGNFWIQKFNFLREYLKATLQEAMVPDLKEVEGREK